MELVTAGAGGGGISFLHTIHFQSLDAQALYEHPVKTVCNSAGASPGTGQSTARGTRRPVKAKPVDSRVPLGCTGL